MFNAFERAVAARYLRARRGERFVSVIAGFSLVGIALGVATLIIVMSVMGGFKVDLLNRILGFNGDLGVYGAAGSITDYTKIARRIDTLPGVTAALPVVDGQVLLTDPRGTSAGGYVRGIAPDDLQRLKAVSDHIVAGSLAQFRGNDAIAIGEGMARRFGVFVGGRITLVSPQGAATPFGTIPRVRAYQVVAIFKVGMSEYRFELRVHAAFRRTDLFPEARRGDADRGAGARPGTGPGHDGGDPPRLPRCVVAGDRLAGEQQQLLHRGAGGAERDVRDPDPDHPGGGVQRDLLADHDGEGQDARYRGAAHPGRGAAGRSCASS